MEELQELGFVARVFVQASLPHRRVAGNEYIRRNGAYTLTMTVPSAVGLPYGSTPRLLLAWLVTEVKRTQQRQLDLGGSIAGFMRELGMPATGGERGSILRLKNQADRLFRTDFQFDMPGTEDWGRVTIADRKQTSLWWDTKRPEQLALFRSVVTLSDTFFTEAFYNGVPVDFRILRALNRSPMALDIYCWLTHRVFNLKAPVLLRWQLLQQQFGSGYPDTPIGKAHFREAFLIQLEAVRKHYRHLRAEDGEGGLRIKPCLPSVLPVDKIIGKR
jgi:hypothetical protein